MRCLISAAAIAALAFSPAAVARDKPAPDGYRWTAPANPAGPYTMVWQLVGSQAELNATVAAEGVAIAEADGDPIMDNVRIRRNRATGVVSSCTATIIDPAKRFDPVVIFHVTLHCMGWTHAEPEG